MDVMLNLRFSFGRGEPSEADDRFFTLLVAVDKYGSLRRASEEAGMSYRAAWGLLRTWTDRLGRPPVEMRRGQGAALSDFGRKLLWANRYARDRVAPALRDLAEEVREALESMPFRAGGLLTVYASHSLAQDILRDLVARETDVTLDFHNQGSLDNLRSLTRGECDLAGFHLAEGQFRRQLAPQYLEWLDPTEHRLVRVASRCQGLMLRRDLTEEVRGPADLVRDDVRFVNRQAGSGTRVLLDALLRVEGIEPSRIKGYDHEEFTHSAVAALLSSGAGNVGFGVEAAAAQFDLRFVPLATETYYFAVSEAAVQSNPAVQDVVSVIAGSEFRRRVAGLKGYDPRHSGRWEPVSGLSG
ncbi:MAG: substrate-binding domain-containing protein [Arenicellales bacterium]